MRGLVAIFLLTVSTLVFADTSSELQFEWRRLRGKCLEAAVFNSHEGEESLGMTERGEMTAILCFPKDPSKHSLWIRAYMSKRLAFDGLVPRTEPVERTWQFGTVTAD